MLGLKKIQSPRVCLFHRIKETSCHGVPLNQQLSEHVPSSVVIFLHFCPVGDPKFFVELVLILESLAQLVSLLLAYFHSVVLRHYLIVDSSFKEPTLCNRERWKGEERKHNIIHIGDLLPGPGAHKH